MSKENPNGFTDKEINSCIYRSKKDPSRYRPNGKGCTCGGSRYREYVYDCALYQLRCATHAPPNDKDLRICDSCEDCTPKGSLPK